MAKKQNFKGEVDAWVRKSKKRMTLVLRQATNDMLADIEIVPGINRGGGRVRGTIPRDVSNLARSLNSSILGGAVFQGEASFVMATGVVNAGQIITFSWGGPVAPYAQHVHYGANGIPGTYWITEAASKWQDYIDSATRRAKILTG